MGQVQRGRYVGIVGQAQGGGPLFAETLTIVPGNRSMIPNVKVP